MTWQTFLFLAVAGAASAYSTKQLWTLYRLLKAQKGQGPKVDRVLARIWTTIQNVLGHRALLQRPAIGIAHFTIFWGFLIITVGTLEQFATTLYAEAHFTFLGDRLYRSFLSLHDFFTLAVLVAVGYALWRRVIIRPEGLGKSKDAMIVLAFTGALMLSIFLMHGFMILGDQPEYASALFVSSRFAESLALLGFNSETNSGLGTFFKWVHMLMVLGFGMYIPGSKHLHVLAAGPNTFLRKLDRPKAMSKINFEDETITQYGAAKVTDLSWKDILDTYACTECGRCQDVCPAYNTQKPLSPKSLIIDLKDNLYRNKAAILAHDYDQVTPLIDAKITEDVIWACTSCRACEIACPVFIQQVDKIYEARRHLVMMESKFPQEVQVVFRNMETNGTPWAFSASDRAAWAEGLSVKTLAEDPSAEVLLWVGCAGAYDDRNKKVLRAFVSLLKKANINFATLGTEEQCTGDPARRIGNEYLYQTLAAANVETLNRYKVKKIVTACPHCFNTIKNEYPDLGGNYEVVHHSQMIASLITDGKLKPTKSMHETVTFHDSCYLGRWNNIYDQPRKVLSSIPSTKLVEMSSHHDKSLCCGAGGGRMWMEETIGKRINIARTEQAIETKAGIIASSCPFCMTMMTDGVKSKELSQKVKVMDIAELMDQAT